MINVTSLAPKFSCERYEILWTYLVITWKCQVDSLLFFCSLMNTYIYVKLKRKTKTQKALKNKTNKQNPNKETNKKGQYRHIFKKIYVSKGHLELISQWMSNSCHACSCTGQCSESQILCWMSSSHAPDHSKVLGKF